MFSVIFPPWMLSFTTGGTVTGKYFLNIRPAILVYINCIRFWYLRIDGWPKHGGVRIIVAVLCNIKNILHWCNRGTEKITQWDSNDKPSFPKVLLSSVQSFVTLFTGYVIYDLMHFYLHYGSPEDGSYLYNMKRYHNQHHFTQHENGEYIRPLVTTWHHHHPSQPGIGITKTETVHLNIISY